MLDQAHNIKDDAVQINLKYELEKGLNQINSLHGSMGHVNKCVVYHFKWLIEKDCQITSLKLSYFSYNLWLLKKNHFSGCTNL